MYSETLKVVDRRERLERVMRAVFVVACYLVVFAGLLYTVASRAGLP